MLINDVVKNMKNQWNYLNLPRKKIKKTELAKYLNKKYLKYSNQIKKSDCELSKIKLKQISEVWDKTFINSYDIAKGELRDKIISRLNVSYLINEKVIIGKNVNEYILSNQIKDTIILSEKNVLSIFQKNYGLESFNKEKIFMIDNITGKGLKKIIEYVTKWKTCCLIGIGGGRVMDYLKYVQMKTNIFCIAIASSLATHVYASPKIHVLPAIHELGEKNTIDGPVPDISLLDIGFLKNLQVKNSRLIKAGLGDLIACKTAIYDWKLAEEYHTTKYNHAVAEMSLDIIKIMEQINVNKNIENWIREYSFIQVLLCNISDWEGSAPVSGSEHLFALAAEKGFKNPPLHGELVALGSIIMTYLQGGDYKKMYHLVNVLGLPTSISKIGLTKRDAINGIHNSELIARKKGRFTIIDTIHITKGLCKKTIENLMKENVIQK